MVKHLLLLLGMPDGATVSAIKKRYARLIDRLTRKEQQPVQYPQDDLQPARERLSESYEYWKKLGVLDQENTSQVLSCTPKLGQVLVASGRITLSELASVLELQKSTVGNSNRFGELLVSIGTLTEEELEYFLNMQRLIELPTDHPERWGQRLVELGMISQDQLKIALIEHMQSGCSLRSAFIKRGWLSAEVLDRIF